MIIKKILEANEKYRLFEGVGHITAACSGGADSMAMLHALCRLSGEFGFTVSAAHFNHGIRGAEADSDENYVRKYCGEHNIPFISGFGDVPSYAREQGLSTELAAREMRYSFLEKASGNGAVATAHHAGDNLETMLFNLTRGTALAGLCGIPPKRGIYIRPLIFCTRDEIEEYCRSNNIDFVTDSTNLADEYARNRIRHKVIPVLREIQPAAEEAAVRTAQCLREDEEYLDCEAEKEYRRRLCDGKLSTENFSVLSASIAKRIIKKFFVEQTGENPDFLHITKMYDCALNGGKTSLPGKLEAEAKNGYLSVKSAEKPKEVRFEVKLNEKTSDFSGNNKKIHNLLLKNSIDCDKIVGKLILRTRMPSDSVYIRSRGGTKTLKKLYNENKIPLNERKYLPVLADSEGIVWVAKIGPAQRCAVTENTRRYYGIDLKEIKGDV